MELEKELKKLIEIKVLEIKNKFYIKIYSRFIFRQVGNC